MEKGYYRNRDRQKIRSNKVAIHNKNGKGLLHEYPKYSAKAEAAVAIHNKNGKGLLRRRQAKNAAKVYRSQSTIKMEKGYYEYQTTRISSTTKSVAIHNKNGKGLLLTGITSLLKRQLSQSTIKMEKGYYMKVEAGYTRQLLSQSTIKMEKGYYIPKQWLQYKIIAVAIHNKNGKGLLLYYGIIAVGRTR